MNLADIEKNPHHMQRTTVLGVPVVEVSDGGRRRCHEICAFYKYEEGPGCRVSAKDSEELMCGQHDTFYMHDTPDADERYTLYLVEQRFIQASGNFNSADYNDSSNDLKDDT